MHQLLNLLRRHLRGVAGGLAASSLLEFRNEGPSAQMEESGLRSREILEKGGSPRWSLSQSWSLSGRTASAPGPSAGDRELAGTLKPKPLPQRAHSRGEPGCSSAAAAAAATSLSAWRRRSHLLGNNQTRTTHQTQQRRSALAERCRFARLRGFRRGRRSQRRLRGPRCCAAAEGTLLYTQALSPSARCTVLGISVIGKSATGTV